MIRKTFDIELTKAHSGGRMAHIVGNVSPGEDGEADIEVISICVYGWRNGEVFMRCLGERLTELISDRYHEVIQEISDKALEDYFKPSYDIPIRTKNVH